MTNTQPSLPQANTGEEREFASFCDAIVMPGFIMLGMSALYVSVTGMYIWLIEATVLSFYVAVAFGWLGGSFFLVKFALPELPDDASKHQRNLRTRHIRRAPITYLIFSFWGLIGLMVVIIYWLYSIQRMVFPRR